MKEDIEKLLRDRYFLKDEKKWSDIAYRVSRIYPEMEEPINNMEFIPSSPTLMNLNCKSERKGTLSSCFILDVDDSIDSIMDTMKDVAEVTRRSGGVGINFSKLRSDKEVVKSTSKNSGGVMSFIAIYDSVLDNIQQGSARRGAGMSLLSIYHPQILDFINAKRYLKQFNRSNFSISIPKEFYEILKQTPEKEFQVQNIVDKQWNILKDEKGNIFTYKKLWNLIVDASWNSAEPGIVNESIIKERSPLIHKGEQIGCNPCQEVVSTVPFISCNLGSINVSKLIKRGKFDWEKFEDLIYKGVNYLNLVVDNNLYPLKKIEETTLSSRPIGLGLMGIAHLLYKLRIPYNSDQAYELISQITYFETIKALKKSSEIAKRKEESYTWYKKDIFLKANERLFDNSESKELMENIKENGIYNCGVTSIAPTGSLSYIANCSSGIEPVFALVQYRKIEKINKEYDEVFIVDPIFEEFVEENYKSKKEKIFKYISSNNGSCQGCSELTKEEQNIFVTARDINPDWHLKILSAVSKNISFSASKTINLSKDCTKEQISEVYLKAQELGIIGVTVYREGSREGILSTESERNQNKNTKITYHDAPKRTSDLDCEVFHYTVKKRKMFVVIGLMEGLPYEIFSGANYSSSGDIYIPSSVDKGFIRKEGKGQYFLYANNNAKYQLNDSHISDEMEALCKSYSQSLRHGVRPKYVVQQMENVKGDMFSISKVMARALKKFQPNEELDELCPQCKSKLIRFDGCIRCSSCVWQKCG